MSGAEPVIPPKDRALEGIIWLVKGGAVRAGDKLPGERDLCERLGVSRTALRGAIKQLCSQGILESRHGSGTYVLPPRPTQVFQQTGSFTDIVAATGRTAFSRIVRRECSQADELIAKKMRIEVGAPVYILSRVRLADDLPISFETSHVDLERCPGIDAHDFERESLLSVIKGAYSIQIVHGVEQLSITRVNEREAELLGVEPGAPAFFEQCYNQDPTGANIEYCRAVTLADRFQYANDDTRNGKASKKVATWLRS